MKLRGDLPEATERVQRDASAPRDVLRSRRPIRTCPREPSPQLVQHEGPAVARAVDDTILPSSLPETITRGGRSGAEDEPLTSSELNLERLERQAILRALQSTGFDKAKAARLLGIGKTTMYRKLKEIGK